RGLAGAVGADDADDGAARDIERQVVDQHAVAVALLEVLRLDDQLAQARARRDVDLARFVARLVFLRLQLLEAGQARLAFGLTALRVGAHPFQFFLDGTLARGLRLLFLGEALFLLFQPARIIALERNAAAAVEFEDPAGDVV